MQADIEALLAQGCHAAPAVTALTVQDTVNVTDFRVLDREWVLAQANAVLNDSEVAAVKLGMLGSLKMSNTVVELLSAHRTCRWSATRCCAPAAADAWARTRWVTRCVSVCCRCRSLPPLTFLKREILAELPEGTADECAEKLLPFVKTC